MIRNGLDFYDEHYMNDVKQFAHQFKMKRLSMGLSQTQVGQALSYKHGHVYSPSVICRFEKQDLSLRAIRKLRPVLEDWMKDVDREDSAAVPQSNPASVVTVAGSHKRLHFTARCRKQRTSFSAHALALLHEYFRHNNHPSGEEMTRVADLLRYDREVIRVWFCNKRQLLKRSNESGTTSRVSCRDLSDT